MKPLAISSLLVLATSFLTGCGDNIDSRLSDSDVAYVKSSRYADAYGSSTATVTSTVTTTSTTTTTTTQADYSLVTVTSSSVSY